MAAGMRVIECVRTGLAQPLTSELLYAPDSTLQNCCEGHVTQCGCFKQTCPLAWCMGAVLGYTTVLIST